MQINISPNMRTITISTSNGFLDFMKIKVAARHISYRTIFHTMLILAFLLPFIFILTAVVTLEGVNKCSSLDCLGRRLGPRFLVRSDDSTKLVGDLYKLLNEVDDDGNPDLILPATFGELVSEIKGNQYDAKTIASKLKGMFQCWIAWWCTKLTLTKVTEIVTSTKLNFWRGGRLILRRLRGNFLDAFDCVWTEGMKSSGHWV